MNVKYIIEQTLNIRAYTHEGAKLRLRSMLDAAVAFGSDDSWAYIYGGNEWGTFRFSIFGEHEIKKAEEISLRQSDRKLFPLNPAVKIKDPTWNFEIDGRLDKDLEFWPAQYEPWYYYPEKYEDLWEFPYEEWADWFVPF